MTPWGTADTALLDEPYEETAGSVLVVDDSEPFLRAAGAVLSASSNLRLAGSASSGEEALRLLPRLKPDLVLLDIHLPGIDGIATARIVRARSPRTVVILVSATPKGFERPGLNAGAVALLDKCDLGVRRLEALWDKHRPAA